MIEKQNAEIGDLKQKVQELQDAIVEQQRAFAGDRSALEEKIARLEDLELALVRERDTSKLSVEELLKDMQQSEAVSAQRHRIIQQMRGSMRVFCRVKPHPPLQEAEEPKLPRGGRKIVTPASWSRWQVA